MRGAARTRDTRSDVAGEAKPRAPSVYTGKDQGLKLPVLGGAPACDDALLKSFGDEAIGVISCSGYTGDLDTPTNKRLIDGMLRDYGNIPGLYAAGL